MQHLTPFLDIKCPSMHVYVISLLVQVRNGHLRNAYCLFIVGKRRRSVGDTCANLLSGSNPGKASSCCWAVYRFKESNFLLYSLYQNESRMVIITSSSSSYLYTFPFLYLEWYEEWTLVLGWGFISTVL